MLGRIGVVEARAQDAPGGPGGQGPGMGLGMGPGMGMGRGRDRDPDGPPGPPPVYLVVGLNAERHLAQFDQYRRAALIQTGYVFLAAVVLWSLAFAYLRRRSRPSAWCAWSSSRPNCWTTCPTAW